MQAQFNIQSQGATRALSLNIHTLIVAGWAGRDIAAIEHHIEELAELGVPRPSSVPLYYRIGRNQLVQDAEIQVVGPHSSGEIEALVFAAEGKLFVGISSDHTDRKLEAHSVALSKQVCAKPAGTDAWELAEVEAHWDELIVRSWIEEDGQRVLYQEGSLSTLRPPRELIAGYLKDSGQTSFTDGTAMTCGTVAAIGGIRASTTFEMELYDPRLNRSLKHRYTSQILPEVA
ncbi:DUF2848 domain-containing protein [Diaphorobacter caeni]|uniref:DUF2848 domain-containing protein n=1 Tax=Diaphorobacter caeni TaxID=2784387 RepID=UPI001890B431|nr:DUF2848 domain-containing protein [Diaphorobacter caeni]MBF5006575.1 DUF2848 domain-containing protein [Diaphorobacter caeni]